MSLSSLNVGDQVKVWDARTNQSEVTTVTVITNECIEVTEDNKVIMGDTPEYLEVAACPGLMFFIRTGIALNSTVKSLRTV